MERIRKTIHRPNLVFLIIVLCWIVLKYYVGLFFNFVLRFVGVIYRTSFPFKKQ